MIPLRKIKFNRATFLVNDIDDVIKACKVALDSADQSDVTAAMVVLNVLGVKTKAKPAAKKGVSISSGLKKWETALEIVRNHPSGISAPEVEKLLPQYCDITNVSSMLADLAKRGALTFEKRGNLKFYTCVPEWRPTPLKSAQATPVRPDGVRTVTL